MKKKLIPFSRVFYISMATMRKWVKINFGLSVSNTYFAPLSSEEEIAAILPLLMTSLTIQFLVCAAKTEFVSSALTSTTRREKGTGFPVKSLEWHRHDLQFKTLLLWNLSIKITYQRNGKLWNKRYTRDNVTNHFVAGQTIFLFRMWFKKKKFEKFEDNQTRIFL